MTREELRAWVAASRAEQGLPPTIADPETLRAVAGMVADTILAAQGGERDGP
jgi:hypothetical protein